MLCFSFLSLSFLDEGSQEGALGGGYEDTREDEPFEVRVGVRVGGVPVIQGNSRKREDLIHWGRGS